MYRIGCFKLFTLYLMAVLVMVPLPTLAQNRKAQPVRAVHQLPYPAVPDEAHRKAADAMLQQIWSAQPGQPKFDAINAVVQKLNQSDVATQNAVAWLCMTYMQDKNRGVLDRWPCEYVLAYVSYEPAIPYLIDILFNDGVEAMRAVAAEALGGWYKRTGNNAIRDALLQSSRTEKSKWVLDTLAKYLDMSVIDPGPNAPDEAYRRAADAVLQQIWSAQPGQPKFDAINAVVQKYKQSDAPTQRAITWLCSRYIKDKSRGVLDRWPCEYVLAYISYEPAIPDLINVLLQDDVEAMRAVAAEALGGWYKSTGNKTIYDALMQSARTEKSQRVLDTLAKYLDNNVPAPSAGPSR